MLEYKRSKKTNGILQFLAEENKIAFYIEIPHYGRVRLRGDILREFLWVLRSNKADRLVPEWLGRVKETLKEMRSGSIEADDAQPEAQP